MSKTRAELCSGALGASDKKARPHVRLWGRIKLEEKSAKDLTPEKAAIWLMFDHRLANLRDRMPLACLPGLFADFIRRGWPYWLNG